MSKKAFTCYYLLAVRYSTFNFFPEITPVNSQFTRETQIYAQKVNYFIQLSQIYFKRKKDIKVHSKYLK